MELIAGARQFVGRLRRVSSSSLLKVRKDNLITDIGRLLLKLTLSLQNVKVTMLL